MIVLLYFSIPTRCWALNIAEALMAIQQSTGASTLEVHLLSISVTYSLISSVGCVAIVCHMGS